MPDGEEVEGQEDSPDEPESPTTPQVDLAVISTFLLESERTVREGQLDSVRQVLRNMFPGNLWTITPNENSYSPDSHSNLYNAEVGGGFRTWLIAQGADVARYKSAIGPTQYVSLDLQLKSLTPHFMGNKGWRLRLVGFPSIDLIVIGLGSHYQGTQSQKKMGAASGLIREMANQVWGPELKELAQGFPNANAEHWDRRGLMGEPILRIGDLDISGFQDGIGAELRMVRNTTVKKELATFFALTGMNKHDFDSRGYEVISTMRSLALRLGEDR